MTPECEFSVLEYLGRLGDGVLVLLSAVHDSEYYEATYYYKPDGDVLTLSEELEAALANTEASPGEEEMLESVRKKVVPYGEIYGRVDEVDFRRWLEPEGTHEESEDVPGEV